MRPSTNHSDDDEQPRVKIHVDRMDSVVARLAREREKGREHGGVVLTDRSNQPQSNNVAFLGGPAGLGSMSDLDSGHELNPSFDLSGDIGLNPGNAFASALNFDFDFENGTTDVFNANDQGGVFNSHPLLPIQLELQESRNFPGTTNVCATTTATSLEENSKTLSPLLSQLFNNEMFTRTTACGTAILAEKIEMMSFSDDDVTDAEKLLSTISHEPNVLEVLDISIKWWIAWRDQAVAMQDVTVSLFSKDDNEEEQQTQGQESMTLECAVPALHSNATETTSSSTRPDSSASLGIRGHHSDPPMSFRDFVLTKLSRSQEPVSFATGLLCVAMSLYQLRPGVDDGKLNISTSPSDLADRIVLAVDTIVLCPTSQHKHTRDPGVLLLLMIRAKMFAESNQLRKSWLCIRRALEIAKDTGFTEPKMPLLGDGLGEYAPKVCGLELTKLFSRQRFIGSIMELDRLMSMVLGFPHAEDVKFTDQLAMAVLKGERQGQKTAPSQGGGDGGGAASTISADIKMRALRRVVSIVAGRVNDRNASCDSDRVKHRTTMDIQATLTEAADAMPQGWWDVGSHLETSDPFLAHEHLTTQMWFWQVQSFLHLPFMLKLNSSAISAAAAQGQNHHDHDHIQNGNNTATDPYEVNKDLCLQGCRGMIRVFNLLRSDPSLAVYICSCEDFQGVFSACILMVGLLMRMSCCSRTLPEPEECEGAIGENVGEDLALIEDIKDIFRYRATEQGGSISRQGLRVLEELGSFLYEDEDVDGGLLDRAEQVKRRTVVLPYFGAIHLELRPPRHHVRDIAKASVLPRSSAIRGFSAAEEMACPSSSEQPVEGRTITDCPGQIIEPMCLPSSNWDREANFDAIASGGLDADTALQFSMPEANLNWDRFLYGHELAQNWSADLPEWPTTMDMDMPP
ncbi:uncharacterized protein A1O5_00359 [Cladophialophora psammophila CBS 110553]|uniref:Transcription factor domain-containing protein n=1 Tax=Cladophialophora psammophila CBS 110553 TaxID=1182543 RepID=W9X5X8_9EURO|nr:uncharacterized protein A1O5_00359 [Cladophialophora psammophila CBS 110553]EXJ75852.1 hypothetical protein A1O5_00359 [Cladophialophora psammophila CBS 110553]